jgi:hypothetical protein
MPSWEVAVVREVEMGCGILVDAPGSTSFGMVGSSGDCRAEADYIACPS